MTLPPITHGNYSDTGRCPPTFQRERRCLRMFSRVRVSCAGSCSVPTTQGCCSASVAEGRLPASTVSSLLMRSFALHHRPQTPAQQ